MSRFEDLTGRQFGRLLVVKRAPSQKGMTAWECLCECGNTTVVQAGNLKKKKRPTVSCGCHSADKARTRHASNRVIPGQVYGKLTVLEVWVKDKKALTRCACSCGAFPEPIWAQDLKSEHTRSCGCLVVEGIQERSQEARIPEGRRYGQLTVLGFSHYNKNNAHYTCVCDCGNVKTYRHSELYNKTRSCGCLKRKLTSTRMQQKWIEWRRARGFPENTPITPLLHSLRAISQELAAAVKHRDHYKCVLCGERATHAHHIVRFVDSIEQAFSPYNIVSLCDGCHFKAHANKYGGPVDPCLAKELSSIAHNNEALNPVPSAIVERAERYASTIIKHFTEELTCP